MGCRFVALAVLLLRLIPGARTCNVFNTQTYIEVFQTLIKCVTPDGTAADYTQFASFISATLDMSSCKDQASCTSLISSLAATTTNAELKDLATRLTKPESQVATCACIATAAPLLDGCMSVITSLNDDFCEPYFAQSQAAPTTLATKAPAKAPSAAAPDAQSCDSALTSLCNFKGMPSFNESISCIKNNLVTLENDCALMLDVIIAGTFRSCAVDIVSKCQSSFGSNSPARTMACLAWNYKTLSPACRGQLEDLAGNVLPCGKESAVYCPDKLLPEDVFQCLANVRHGSLSPVCEDMVVGYTQCKDTIGELLPPMPPSLGDDNSKGGDDNRGSGDDSEPKNKPGKSKPKPGAGEGKGKGKGKPSDPPKGIHASRHLQTDDRPSEPKSKPKPRPGQNGSGTKPKSKPPPGRDDGTGIKGGGAGKSKPSPGGSSGTKGAGGPKQKPCWQKIGKEKGSKGKNGEFPGGEGESAGAAGTGAGDSSTTGTDANINDDPPPPNAGPMFPIAILVISALLLAVIAYRARSKIHEMLNRFGLVGGRGAQNNGASPDVEMSAYVRASEDETDFDSSSHPLAANDKCAKDQADGDALAGMASVEAFAEVQTTAAIVVPASEVQM